MTPADHRDSSSGGRQGGDDWLGDVEGLDWDGGERQPFSWPEQRDPGARSSERATYEEGVAHEHPDDAICVTSVGLATVAANLDFLESARARSRLLALR